MTAPSAAWMLDVLGHWADRGWLRPLDVALARFVAELSVAVDGPPLLAIALAAHVEGQGHTCLVLPDLLADADGLLGWPTDAGDALRFVLARMPATTEDWVDALRASGVVDHAVENAQGDTEAGGKPFVIDGDRFYLRRYWRHERRIARACTARAATPVAIDDDATRRWIDRLFDARPADDHGDPGIDWQKVACALAMRARIALITGGPGTGKTYTAARLLALLFATSPDPVALRVALAAPTGKAAARLGRSIDTALTGLRERLGDALPLPEPAGRVGRARTLHALLGTQRRTRRFRHDAAHPLELDVLIVDEASMIHVEMMDALLDALPAHATLFLIGDKDQLASVEAGAVLGELCADAYEIVDGAANEQGDEAANEQGNEAANEAASETASQSTDTGRYTRATIDAVARLTGQRIGARWHDAAGPLLAQQTCTLRRSERFGGAIARFARAVNAGRVDDARAALVAGDGTLVHVDDASPADVGGLAVRGYASFAAAVDARPDSLLGEDHDGWVRRVLETFDTFRVLCAVREGAWGVAGLNAAIEKTLFGAVDARVEEGWYPGRPVIATRNDDDLGIFNGDVGIALRTSPTDAGLRVWFADGSRGAGIRSVSVGRLADVETAFAMTVHRAQGSEFDAVLLALPPEAGRVTTRQLLYTGITRARARFTLVSSHGDALADAIGRTTRRSSGIAAMLRRFDASFR